jgi:hypothetical protein
MGRRYQTFVAPGEEEKELPILESIWHVGGATHIPAEHWDILIEFVYEKLPEHGDLFEKASYLGSPDVRRISKTNQKSKLIALHENYRSSRIHMPGV